jgi:hypothetical protein
MGPLRWGLAELKLAKEGQGVGEIPLEGTRIGWIGWVRVVGSGIAGSTLNRVPEFGREPLVFLDKICAKPRLIFRMLLTCFRFL